MLSPVTSLSLVSCRLLLTSNTVSLAADTKESPWRGTGIDLGYLSERLNDRHCRRTDRAFLSCLGAVQAVLDLQGRDRQLFPASVVAESNEALSIVGRFGAAAVVEDRSLRVKSDGNALQVVRARTHRIVRWRDWLRSGRRDEVHFSAIRDWLRAQVVDADREEEFAAAAINGYLAVADAHARIAPAGTVGDGPTGRRGAKPSGGINELVYTGIGAAVQPMVDAALVSAVVREGPAASAGLSVHDFILAVDGEPITGLSTEEVVEKLRGRSGTKVSVTVKRQDEIHEIEVLRDVVTVKNVAAHEFIDRGWRLVYLKIDGFARGDTCREAYRELDKVLKPITSGLILDLRDNAGGLIDQAVCVADLFLPEDELVLEIRDVSGAKRTERIRTRRAARLRAPMVTLVNATTGSAAEVLAGALQDHGRSVVVGETTFGKGTVQRVRPWRGSQSILEFFTAARYYRPSGVGVQLIGIKPDVPLTDIPGLERQDRVVLREGDLFPTALPREPELWQHPNPELATTLRECATEEGLAVHRQRRDAEVGRSTDYGLIVGQDTLVCRLTERI